MIPLSRGVYLRNGSQRANVVSNSQAVSSRSRTARREGVSRANASTRRRAKRLNRGSLTHDRGRVTGDSELRDAALLRSLTGGVEATGDETEAKTTKEERLALNRIVVLRYRSHLESRQLAPGTINLRLGAVRRLAYEAADCGLLSADLAAGIRRVKCVKKLGIRLGNWLTAEQSHALWQAPDRQRPRGKRDRALLALLLACGLRRHEAVTLKLDHLQQREEHWAIVDLVGKGGHIRTVPVHDWVRNELDDWLAAAAIDRGRLFRRVNKVGRAWGEGITEKSIWHIVKESARTVGVGNLAPHDLRRTCARLCHASGGELEQIQFLLGHVSVQTTERYLGCKQRIRSAVNDRI